MLKEPKVLTVSELTRDIKEVLENVFSECFVEGEVSNFRQPSSGHLYFSLKDEACSVRCVVFRGSAARLKFAPTDGIRVVARGRIGVYERDGQYQLYIEELEPKGRGELQLAFEQLKERLSREGLFEESRKKPLPFLPESIGVVTSPTGSVIRDILHILDRRFPAHHVIIEPVRVQGEGAAVEVARAIDEFNELECVDVIILARGGGSLEDLWAFNEEIVARAIARSAIPVVSAIGHETDYTISDFVADRRAPTPSAAAEIVMPQEAELKETIDSLLVDLHRALADLLPQRAQRIDELAQALLRAFEQRIRHEDTHLKGLLDQLGALSPVAVLKRGYSITTRAEDGGVLVSTKDLKHGQRVRTRLSHGEFESEVTNIL